MNSRPITLRFASGSVTPDSADKNRSAASTTLRSTPVAATKSRSTCSASPLRSSPWSTKTQVSWPPTARWTSAAATAESTPARQSTDQVLVPDLLLDRERRRRPRCLPASSPACSPRCRTRTVSSTSWPAWECSTSGCHCTPAKPRPASSKAAIGAPSAAGQSAETGRRTQPPRRRGSSTLGADAGRSASRGSGLNDRGLGTAELARLRCAATSPPSARAMAWNP